MDGEPCIRVDGRTIDAQAVDREAQYHAAPSLAEARRRAISQYIRLLAANHDIEGFDLGAATSPLVR